MLAAQPRPVRIWGGGRKGDLHKYRRHKCVNTVSARYSFILYNVLNGLKIIHAIPAPLSSSNPHYWPKIISLPPQLSHIFLAQHYSRPQHPQPVASRKSTDTISWSTGYINIIVNIRIAIVVSFPTQPCGRHYNPSCPSKPLWAPFRTSGEDLHFMPTDATNRLFHTHDRKRKRNTKKKTMVEKQVFEDWHSDLKLLSMEEKKKLSLKKAQKKLFSSLTEKNE